MGASVGACVSVWGCVCVCLCRCRYGCVCGIVDAFVCVGACGLVLARV